MAEEPNKFAEIGSTGLEAWGGWVKMAYATELTWPTCAALYNRIWRSDPEVGIARAVLDSMSSQLDIRFELHPEIETPTDDDKRAVDFGNQVLSDLEDGIGKWINSCMKRVPFYGWGWWEAPLGLRSAGWSPPDQGDPWRSQYDDGLVGYRGLRFRHYSSFSNWELSDDKGRLRGMAQFDPPNPLVTIPLDRSLHVTFGDSDNPEGLAVMEPLWRLERYKFNLEVVQGIGFEHAAGHVSITAEEDLGAQDEARIKKAVRALLTAQEGNYAAWPKGVKGEVIDVPFSAAVALLDAIRYYGIVKLGLIFMQWAALGTMSPYGSYASMTDASEFFLSVFNSMAEGFVFQADAQIGKRLYELPVNAAAFPDMTRRPRLVVSKAQKAVKLADLGQFLQVYAAIAPLSDDDLVAIRKKSDFLPETLPEADEAPEEAEPKAETPEEEEPDSEDVTPPGNEDMATRRTFRPADDENPTTTAQDAYIDEADINKAMKAFESWATDNAPDMAKILKAKVIEGDKKK